MPFFDLMFGFNYTHVAGLVSFLVFLLYLHHKRKYSFWSSRGVKGPTPWPIFGNSFETFFEPVTEVDKRNARKYGPTFGIFDGSTPILMTTDLELIEEVYTKQFSTFSDHIPNHSEDPFDNLNILSLGGEHWKRIRSVVTATLTITKLKAICEALKSCTGSLTKHLGIAADKGTDVDLKQMYGLFVIDVVSKAFFSLDLKAFENPDNQLYKSTNVLFNFDQMTLFLGNNLPPFINRLLGYGGTSSGDREDYIKNLVIHLVKQRKESGLKCPDFLQTLIDSQEGEKSGKANFLTETEIIANAVFFIAAAYETTSASLSYTTHELAVSPEAQAKVYQEVRNVLGPNGPLDYDTLSSLTYTCAAQMEALRLHTGDLRGFRRPIKDVAINGIDLPKGTQFVPLFIPIHRDPNNFPDPDKFDPTRFLPENKDKLKPCSFMAFGAGPRMCPGIKMAKMIATLALASAIQQFEFVKSPATKVPPEYPKGSLMLQGRGLVVRVKRRQ